VETIHKLQHHRSVILSELVAGWVLWQALNDDLPDFGPDQD
jgi:hypothetical protein